jgi:hypothetical protein
LSLVNLQLYPITRKVTILNAKLWGKLKYVAKGENVIKHNKDHIYGFVDESLEDSIKDQICMYEWMKM